MKKRKKDIAIQLRKRIVGETEPSEDSKD